MFSKERFPVSRTVPLFPNINGDFIPLGTTHYNTISGSVNRKTQDIVLFNKKSANRGTDFTTFAVPVPFGCMVCPFTFSGLLPGVGRKNDQPCNVTPHGYWAQTASPLNI